jgi:Flp pilus assembly protein TadG
MEIVILAPIIIVFLLLLAGLGRLVEARGQVYGAARDAARAASVSREPAAARLAADDAARRDLVGWCEERQPPTEIAGSFAPGGEISVYVSCTVDLAGLAVVGFTPKKLIRESATVPLDTYFRAGGGSP